MLHIRSFHLPYIEALRASGHEVLIMASGEGADFNIPFQKKITSVKNFKEVKSIRKILDAEKFDTVILNTSLAAFFIRLAMRRRERPTVVNLVHGYLFPIKAVGLRARFKRRLLLTAERLLRGKTDKIVTMNKEDTEIALKYRLAPSVIECRGMGIMPDEAPRDREALRRELGMDGKQIILFVGELSARKNQTFLIELMPSIRAEFPNAELWLIGDGDKYGEQRALVSSLGLEDCVYHLGRREDARNFTAACDLYISASHIEGLPFNIVEALMLDAPTVASDIKGHRDILADGAGFLFAPGDKADALNKIIPILKGDANISKKACDAAVLRYRFSEVFLDTLDKITTENERK